MPLSDSGIIFYCELINKLENAEHGEHGALIQGMADFFRISRNKVYRDLKLLGYETDRKSRIGKAKNQELWLMEQVHNALLSDTVIEQLREVIERNTDYSASKTALRYLLLRLIYDNRKFKVMQELNRIKRVGR
ncbi:MAG: hypothetical protein PHP00_06815 [Thiotrichaceae bacterium]|nr:hypothetical protein [Thiotrichaceae bacterium]